MTEAHSGTGVPPVSSLVLFGVPPVSSSVPLGGTPKPHVPPVNSEPLGQEAHATVRIRQGAYLPHWTREGALYAVTFRLGDSLPRSVLEAWLAERQHIILTAQQMGRPLSVHEEQRLQHLHSERVEAYLDTGHGACWLCQPQIAEVVADALRFFDDQRYHLHAWCVMPNHVHVIVEPIAGHELPALLHSWKSFTAKAANRLLGRTGNFWQEEYYDHLIRDEGDYAHAMHYLLDNPVNAGLVNWPWVRTSGTGILPVSSPNMGGTPMPLPRHEGTGGMLK